MVWEFEHSSVLEWKLHFPVQWPLQSFPDMLTYWVQHLTASSFRILNCSAAIPSPPLAMFLVILPKAHLTSHSKMPGSRWVTTPSWFSRSFRSFFVLFFCLICHPFFISSASVRSFLFVLYCAHLGMKCSLGMSNFLEQISRLSLSFVSLHLHWSSRKPFLPLLAVPGISAFRRRDLSFSPLPFTSLLFSAICKASSEMIFLLAFLFLGDGFGQHLL